MFGLTVNPLLELSTDVRIAIINERTIVYSPFCRYLSTTTLNPLLQSVDLSGSCIRGNGLEQLLSSLTRRKRLVSSNQQNSMKLSLCQCGIEPPLPEIDRGNIVVVTNSSMLLKVKQLCTDRFVLMLELYGNDSLCQSQLESWTQF